MRRQLSWHLQMQIANQPDNSDDSGQTKGAGESIIIQEQLLDIWPEEQVSVAMTPLVDQHSPAM